MVAVTGISLPAAWLSKRPLAHRQKQAATRPLAKRPPTVHELNFHLLLGNQTMDNQGKDDTLITLTADIVAAHVSNNSVAVNDLPQLIQNVHGALVALSGAGAAAEAKPEPKVPIRSSIKPDYIVCLEDGKRLKMLKRHLMTHYQMTPDQYRQKWGLAADYPMVAPNYAEQRRTLAKAIGLGTKRRKSSGSRRK
jgi:predicted transcriptional regulator